MTTRANIHQRAIKVWSLRRATTPPKWRNPGPNMVYCAGCGHNWMEGNIRAQPVVPAGKKVLASNAIIEQRCPKGHLVNSTRRES